jgi:hypothetical protein
MHGLLISRLHLHYPGLVEIVANCERTGIMAPAHDAGFNGYAHNADELRAEVLQSGLALETLVSVENIAFTLHDLDARLADPDERALLFDTLRRLESVPDLIGVGPHMLATARKP